ncbi:MAG: ABC transporter ATP-binding protein [Spirochaetes bacterium]|nr:ABC transporter ATP-binding protein [Spirochaetota bacterium]
MSIAVHNLHFAYHEQPIVQGINLTIPSKKFTAILGKNGSGKSTLLKLMAGLLHPTSGTIHIFDKPLSKLSLKERARLIGYLPQRHVPTFPFLVEEFVLTGRASYIFSTPSKTDKRQAHLALQRAGVQHLQKRPYTELSGGELQMVMIARVLAQEAPIILLDEPVTHLDLPHTERVMTMLSDLAHAGFTIIAILHDINIASRYAEHVVMLKEGKVLHSGTMPHDVTTVEDMYEMPLKTYHLSGKTFFVPREKNAY